MGWGEGGGDSHLIWKGQGGLLERGWQYRRMAMRYFVSIDSKRALAIAPTHLFSRGPIASQLFQAREKPGSQGERTANLNELLRILCIIIKTIDLNELRTGLRFCHKNFVVHFY